MRLEAPLQGEQVMLATLEPAAAEGPYLSWMWDAGILRHLEARFSPHSADSLRAYIERANASEDLLLLGIFERAGGRHVGNVKLGPVHPVHRYGDIGIIIGDSTVHGRGYGAEAIRLLVGYAFGTLGLHKLTAGCYGDNAASVKLFEKCGFAVEGVRRAHYRSGEAWVSGILFGLLAGEGEPASGAARDKKARETT